MSQRRLNKERARKLLLELGRSSKFIFTGHALKELQNDDLDRMDAINVIMSSSASISKEPELISGTWRYRIETKNICVVFAFTENHAGIVIVTVFRIERR